MKKLITIVALFFASTQIYAFETQESYCFEDSISPTKELSKITKNDGSEFVGEILSEDAREILVELLDGRKVYIPAHEIRKIEKVKEGTLNQNGEVQEREVFATRYDFTTNALPIEKGESYYSLNLYGPEVHFGVSKNLGVGILTTWLGAPMLGSIKYTHSIEEKVHVGVGALVGTMSWAQPDVFLGLPFGMLTFGDKLRNLNFSAGYGIAGYDGEFSNIPLASIAGMAKVNKSITFVFDSVFIFPEFEGMLAILTPAIRLHRKNNNSSFQFGFTAISAGGETAPIPLPNLKWYYKI
jgi:hypothetical protein